MNLKESRILFTSLIIKLIGYMIEKGFKPCVGKDGLKHMKNSLHYEGLAMDIDLYDECGCYLSDTASHKQFGEFWESLNPLCSWGGHFNDGNHYSIKFGGRK